MPLTDVAASALARLRRGGSILWPVLSRDKFVFAAFTQKFTFSGTKIAGYAV